MKFKLRASTFKELLIQLLLIVGLLAVLILGFFYIYLPAKTNHGDTQTVPNLIKRPFTQEVIQEWIIDKDFRYKVVEDSVYDSDYPPLTILRQDPKPLSKVKSNRKIYIALNRAEPPKVRMPYLIDGSIKNAQEVLRSNGLRLGTITYKPDLALNAILAQGYDGEFFDKEKQADLKEGILIPKGSTIDVVVGDGLGRQRLKVPNIVGLELVEAEFALVGNGLKVGSTIYMGQVPDTLSQLLNPTDTLAADSIPEPRFLEAGQVVRQKPGPDKTIRVGDEIDLWLAGTKEEYEAKLAADSLTTDTAPY